MEKFKAVLLINIFIIFRNFSKGLDSTTRSLDAETAPRNVYHFVILIFSILKRQSVRITFSTCYSESERQRRSLTLAEKRRRNETLAVGKSQALI